MNLYKYNYGSYLPDVYIFLAFLMPSRLSVHLSVRLSVKIEGGGEKHWSIFVIYFGIELPKKGTNELSKDRFSLIALKGPFSS